jgi:hypothetical protein
MLKDDMITLIAINSYNNIKSKSRNGVSRHELHERDQRVDDQKDALDSLGLLWLHPYVQKLLLGLHW